MNRRGFFAALLGCVTVAAAPARVIILRVVDPIVQPRWTQMTVDGFDFRENYLLLVQEMTLEEFRRRYP
jgi:hypothetical protein